jgi:hypothetical protein
MGVVRINERDWALEPYSLKLCQVDHEHTRGSDVRVPGEVAAVPHKSSMM